MKKIYSLITESILLFAFSTQLSAQCTGGRYQNKIFPAIPIVTTDVVYGNNIKYDGSNQVLKMDIYEPQCDVATARACVIIIHGGGFVAGTKSDLPYVQLCVGLAQVGYVVASIEYRLGFPQDQYGFNSAIMRGVHDGRAAVRFMRDNALNGGNTWRIDPNIIYFGGPSAGGITALHLGYQNLQSELTMNCGGQPGAEENSLEGTSNNLTCSSSVNAIICISGGIRDLSWIHNNDLPVFLAHGDSDNTVPYGSGSFGGFFPIEGGSTVAVRCNQTATPYCFKRMYGQDHQISNFAYTDTLSVLLGQFLYHCTCGAPLDCNYNPMPPAPVPSVSIAVTTGTNPSCQGALATFTATTVNPGPVTPMYQWQVNGVNVGTNSPTYSSTTLATNDVVTCTISSICTEPTTATSPSITMTVTPIVPPTITISVPSSSNPTCPGQSITFTATGTDFGSNPAFQWHLNGNNIGPNSASFTSTTLLNNDIVTCTVTSNAPCVNPTTATSAGITMIVNPVGPPTVSIVITSGTNPTCAGDPVTFTASSTFGGTSPTYQWMKNGTNTLTGVTYTPSTLANGDVVTCKVTSNSACASPTTATSSGITMTVNPLVAPAISIAITSGTTLPCFGNAVTFTATPTYGGTTPAYQWQVNGANVGSDSTNFTSTTLANSDIVTCILTSNVDCRSQATGTSNAIAVTISPNNPPPTVAISILSGNNPTCAASPVTFTATSTDGGTSPVYQWMINGTNAVVSGLYTPSTLVDGDVITCMVTSTAACASPPTAISTAITMTVISSVIPTVTVAVTSGSNPICIGDSVTFTATPSNAGTNPTYQWSLNGNQVAGAQSATYTPTSPADGDVINCKITSDAICASPAMITSTGITITIIPVTTINAISDIDVCGGTIAASNFSSTPSGANYTWTNSNTAIGLASSGTGNVPSYTATNSSSAPITATITVTPSISGCTGTPSSYSITVEPTATISQNGSLLTSSTGSSYQWYIDGQPIIGATSQTITASQSGNYSVAVSGNDCPSQVITITGITEANNDFCFSVFPNPSDGNFFVSFDVPERNTYIISIVNLTGVLLFRESLTDFSGKYSKEMNFTDFGKGIYMIRLSGPEREVVKKIIIY